MKLLSVGHCGGAHNLTIDLTACSLFQQGDQNLMFPGTSHGMLHVSQVHGLTSNHRIRIQIRIHPETKPSKKLYKFP